MVLASADPTSDLPKLAEMADKIIEVATPPTVAATSTSVSKVQQLKEEVKRLTQLVSSIAQHRPRQNQRRLSSRRSPSPASTDSRTSQICWYHKKFGEAAQKCQQPCSWGNE